MRAPWLATLTVVVWGACSSACESPLGPRYEYEEQLYLSMDGSATVVIDSSIAAFVALRDLPLDPSYDVPVDRDQVRRLFAVSGCGDVRVGQPWVRSGRRFVQVRLSVDSIEQLAACSPVAWSSYAFGPDGDLMRYEQRVGPSAGQPPPGVNWTGQELVAFKLHVPSRIDYHNVRRLEDGTPGRPDRGNILTWEQRLTDRLRGEVVEMDVRMHPQSILHRTLWLFGGAFAAAVILLGSLIWMTVRRARRTRAAGRP